MGAEEQDLQAIRRFSVGNVVMWILLAIVFYTIVGAIQEVGLQSIIDAISRRERADPHPGADHRPEPSVRGRPQRVAGHTAFPSRTGG